MWLECVQCQQRQIQIQIQTNTKDIAGQSARLWCGWVEGVCPVSGETSLSDAAPQGLSPPTVMRRFLKRQVNCPTLRRSYIFTVEKGKFAKRQIQHTEYKIHSRGDLKRQVNLERIIFLLLWKRGDHPESHFSKTSVGQSRLHELCKWINCRFDTVY